MYLILPIQYNEIQFGYTVPLKPKLEATSFNFYREI